MLNCMTKKVLFLLSASFAFTQSLEASTINSLIQDVELRTQYNFDQEEYSNALRFKIGNLKLGNRTKLIDLQQKEEQSGILFVTAQSKILNALENEKINIAKAWKKDLKKAYRAYKEYLKSNPSSARTSTQISVQEFLIKSEAQSLSTTPLNEKKVLSTIPNKALLRKNLISLENKKVSLAQNSGSESSLLKFVEISARGNYQDSRSNEGAARLAFNLPLGGSRIESKKKAVASQYKIRKEKLQKEQKLNQVFNELEGKRKLFISLKSSMISKSKVRRLTSSTAVDANDKLKIYLDALKTSYKVLELKSDIALLYNELLMLTASTDKTQFLGLD